VDWRESSGSREISWERANLGQSGLMTRAKIVALDLEEDIVAGSGRAGWRFKEKTPLWFKLIVGLIVVDSVVHFGMLWTVSSWAMASPDAAHTYRVPFRDGVIYFVQPWLGHYLDARWLGIGLLALLVLLLVVKRDQLERGI
jgi:hypothetical protein